MTSVRRAAAQKQSQERRDGVAHAHRQGVWKNFSADRAIETCAY
jgi:hypothetical protein